MQGGGWGLSPALCSAALLPLGVLLNALFALTQVEAAIDEEQYSVKVIKKNYIYGNIKHQVNIYVKVYTNSPFLVCMDLALSQKEVIDPNYLWIGPNGKTLKGQSYVNLTETGKLMVRGFQESMSGSYTCTLSYKTINTDIQEEREKFKTYKFMVYAYREPDYTYQISVRFTTKECRLAANGQFFEELKKILNDLISDLTCHVIEPSYKCHVIKIPKHGLLDELFVTFQVNPFAPGWEAVCQQISYDCEDVTNRRVQEARDLIEEFFRKQTYVLKHEFRNVPAIHYIDHSFEVTRIDSCRPGFGKNDDTHNDCASCCVVCDPGTYSPNNEVRCQICTSIRIKHYGAKSC
ncbi:zona pellucida-binding protein 2 isoform X1 [Mauremys reevesii]|uniref:zona pellucida-binding protein 2 isoform X1 n=2 Tax=Mauremys reevesii TaxID=260615 RepID=UPI00193F03D3|nr:zona pellucida-binding protein 2 isoform X1 [Mauremys reevesii]